MHEHPEGDIPGSGRAGEPKALGSSLRITGWVCPHVRVQAAVIVLLSASSSCGCDMRPIYPQAA